jgi:hypothetical protein
MFFQEGSTGTFQMSRNDHNDIGRVDQKDRKQLTDRHIFAVWNQQSRMGMRLGKSNTTSNN